MIPLHCFPEMMLKVLSIASTIVFEKGIDMPPVQLMQLLMQVFTCFLSSLRPCNTFSLSLALTVLIIISSLFCSISVGIALKEVVADPLDQIRLCMTSDDEAFPDPDTVVPSRLDLFTSACKAKTSKLSTSILNVFSKWIINPCMKSNEQVISSFERCISDDATACTLGLDCSTLDKCLVDTKLECSSQLSSQITAFNQQVLHILIFIFDCVFPCPSLSSLHICNICLSITFHIYPSPTHHAPCDYTLTDGERTNSRNDFTPKFENSP